MKFIQKINITILQENLVLLRKTFMSTYAKRMVKLTKV